MSGAGSCGMGLRQPSVNQGPQGLLPFDFDASDATDEVTGRAGLPLLLETMMARHSSGGTIAKLGASKSSTMW